MGLLLFTHLLRRRDEARELQSRAVRRDPRTLVAEQVLPILEGDTRNAQALAEGYASDRPVLSESRSVRPVVAPHASFAL